MPHVCHLRRSITDTLLQCYWVFEVCWLAAIFSKHYFSRLSSAFMIRNVSLSWDLIWARVLCGIAQHWMTVSAVASRWTALWARCWRSWWWKSGSGDPITVITSMNVIRWSADTRWRQEMMLSSLWRRWSAWSVVWWRLCDWLCLAWFRWFDGRREHNQMEKVRH